MEQSLCVLASEPDEQRRWNICDALKQYQQQCDSEQQIIVVPEQSETIYQGFQNKRSLKIKPVNMFKDLISLQKENAEKKKYVKELEEMNCQLKNEYDLCISHNNKLEHFFKEVEFTFQPEKNKPFASQIMVRATKTLHQQAKEAKERMKRMYKSSEASAIQELKVYIAVLEDQKQGLKRSVSSLQQYVTQRIQEEDFNALQVSKFNAGCQRIKKAFNNEIQSVKNRHQEYKVDKMLIKGKVKARNLEAEKKRYKNQCENMKALLREFEGLEYEIELLKHRVKDRKKQTGQYEQLLGRISNKESITVRLQKQLRQKYKTYEYMLEWSKELKKQLDSRKSEHAKKKAAFQDQINTLTTEYQKYSQIYKAGLFEEQAAKRKGSRELVTPSEISKPSYVKLVTFQQIRASVRSLAFFLLDSEQSTDQFIDDLLVIRNNSKLLAPEKEGRKLKLKAAFSLQKCPMPVKDALTLQEICDNFDFNKSHNLSKEEYKKIAQFIVEDGQTTLNNKLSVPIKVAKQILKTLLRREIEAKQDLVEAVAGIKKLIKSHGDNIRPELKLSGGCEEEIDVNVLKAKMRKYGLDPYCCNLYSEYFQFESWKKRGNVGFIKLIDYDQIVFRISKSQQNVVFTEEEDQNEF